MEISQPNEHEFSEVTPQEFTDEHRASIEDSDLTEPSDLSMELDLPPPPIDNGPSHRDFFDDDAEGARTLNTLFEMEIATAKDISDQLRDELLDRDNQYTINSLSEVEISGLFTFITPQLPAAEGETEYMDAADIVKEQLQDLDLHIASIDHSERTLTQVIELMHRFANTTAVEANTVIIPGDDIAAEPFTAGNFQVYATTTGAFVEEMAPEPEEMPFLRLDTSGEQTTLISTDGRQRYGIETVGNGTIVHKEVLRSLLPQDEFYLTQLSQSLIAHKLLLLQVAVEAGADPKQLGATDRIKDMLHNTSIITSDPNFQANLPPYIKQQLIESTLIIQDTLRPQNLYNSVTGTMEASGIQAVSNRLHKFFHSLSERLS